VLPPRQLLLSNRLNRFFSTDCFNSLSQFIRSFSWFVNWLLAQRVSFSLPRSCPNQHPSSCPILKPLQQTLITDPILNQSHLCSQDLTSPSNLPFRTSPPDTPSQSQTKAPVLKRAHTMAVPSVLSTKPVRVFVIVSSTLCLFVFWSAILSSMWTFESELVKDGGESAEQSDQVCHVLVISTYPPRRLVTNPIFKRSLFSC
jgi:hypothetical protein